MCSLNVTILSSMTVTWSHNTSRVNIQDNVDHSRSQADVGGSLVPHDALLMLKMQALL